MSYIYLLHSVWYRCNIEHGGLDWIGLDNLFPLEKESIKHIHILKDNYNEHEHETIKRRIHNINF